MALAAPPLSLPSWLSAAVLSLIITTGTSRASVAAFVPSQPQRHKVGSTSSARSGTTGERTATTSSTCRPSTALGAHILDLTDIINDFQYLTSSFPLATQSATFGTFAGVGDALAQSKEGQGSDDSDGDSGLDNKGSFDSEDARGEESGTGPEVPELELESESESQYDPVRSARFVLKGLGAGLIWSAWYPFADGWSSQVTADLLARTGVADVGNVHTIAKTASSILLEQFVACPIVYSLWDIPVPALLSGASLGSIPGTVRDKVPGLLLDNAKVWTVANIVVYNLPVEWRVFFVSVCEIFWASIVSSVATKETGVTISSEVSDGSNTERNQEIGDEIMDIITAERRQKIEIVSAAAYTTSEGSNRSKSRT